jgi:PleD family two-component response regulator
MYKLKVLVVDDDRDILDLLEAVLFDEYQVIMAENGTQALAKAHQENPDFLILDYNLPDMQGVDICRALRKDPLFLNTPILMLTGKGEVEDKVKGLEAGVDDYMVKPFVPQELIARIRMLIRRSNTNLDANPLTRLPGNVSINRDIETRLKNKEKFAVLYFDLNYFKSINDYYGFNRGDQVIKETSRILINATQKKGNVSDFIGHIGGDDFVIISSPDKAEDIAKQVIADFDKTAPLFFDEPDRIKGYIETKNRDGDMHNFSFPTIAVGIITNLNKEFSHIAEISSLGAEMKCFAKKFPESKYIFDRRGT